MILTQEEMEIFATGNDPIDNEGYYFQTDENTWFALWLYVCNICHDLLTDEQVSAFADRDFTPVVTQEDSIEIAKRIFKVVEEGKLQNTLSELHKFSTPFTFTIEDLKNFANFSGLSGGFTLS